jgi:hypothetical protein
MIPAAILAAMAQAHKSQLAAACRRFARLCHPIEPGGQPATVGACRNDFLDTVALLLPQVISV